MAAGRLRAPARSGICGRLLRRLLNLLVWGAALALYVLGPYRFGRILALDFEALIINLSQDYSPMQAAPWFASRDWVPAGKLLLWLGPLPTTLLVGARVGYRLLRKPLDGANPLARLRSAVMMLNHIGDTQKNPGAQAVAQKIKSVYNLALADGCKTRDLGGALNSDAFADALIERL